MLISGLRMSDFDAFRNLVARLIDVGEAVARANVSDGDLALARRHPLVFDVDDARLVFKPKLGFCKFYAKSTGGGCLRNDCPRLHICPHYASGHCTWIGTCTKSHDIRSEHNLRVLSQLGIEGFPERMLYKIVHLSPDYHFLPDVCLWFNATGCRNGLACRYIHLCKMFIAGHCNGNCGINHDFFERQCDALLKSHGVYMEKLEVSRVLTGLQEKMVTKHIPLLDQGPFYAGSDLDVVPSILDVPQVCGYFWKGMCGSMGTNGSHACVRLHSLHLYHWQVSDGSVWYSVPSKISENLEEEFSNPASVGIGVFKNTDDPPKYYASGLHACMPDGEWFADFEDMTILAVSVKLPEFYPEGICLDLRRIATVSWKKAEYAAPYMSKYRWYFGDDGSLDWREINDLAPYYDADDVEHAYQSGLPSYFNIDFKDMIGFGNDGRIRDIRRRPCFDYEAEVKQKTLPVPSNWMDMGKLWLKRVPLSERAPEFQELARAMPPGAVVVSVQRVQNPALWQMMAWKKRRWSAEDTRLFTVTDPKFAGPICQENFHPNLDKTPRLDGTWGGVRFSATPAAAYGVAFGGTNAGGGSGENRRQPCYARAEDGGVYMFAARVIVGRLLLKKPLDEELNVVVREEEPYTVVDNLANPSCFVKFDSVEVYPEYLIHCRM